MNSTYLRGGITIIAIALAFLFIKSCDDVKEQKQVKSESSDYLIQMMNEKVAENFNLKKERTRMQRDMLAMRSDIGKVEHHYHTVYVDAYQAAPDTCKPYLDAINRAHEQTDSTKNAFISKQDRALKLAEKEVANYNDIGILKDYFYSQRGDTIQELKLELKTAQKQAKKQKRIGIVKTVASSIGSFFAGFGISKLTK